MTPYPQVQTIIQNVAAYSEYPFEATDASVLSLFHTAHAALPGTKSSFGPLLKSLECFLQLTSQRLSVDDIENGSFLVKCEQFIGALYSDEFIRHSLSRRYTAGRLLEKLINSLPYNKKTISADHFDFSSRALTDFVIRCQGRFAQLSLDSHQVWLWRGWPTTNRSRRTTFLPFYPLAKRFGKDFTSKLHEACDQYYSGRRCQRIIAIPQLVMFLCEDDKTSPPDLLSREYITGFWRRFFLFYIRRGHSEGVQITVLLTNWNNEFVFFAKNYLIGSGLFATPLGRFPGSVDGARKAPSKTNIRASPEGDLVKTKLVTHIPLQVTDPEAMELLFFQIGRDVDVALKWARHMAEDLWNRYLQREEAAALGEARIVSVGSANTGARWLANRENPDYLRNICSTFRHHGYLIKNEIALNLLYGNNLSFAAYELALPTTGSLIAHCTILVATHPVITSAFLEKLELYDKNGNCVGLFQVNGRHILTGYKDRNGPNKAQQRVELTEETAAIVIQIIDLTRPLRDYLRKRGDDNWRYLFLTSGRSFAYPRPIFRLATDTSLPQRLERFSASLAATTDMTPAECNDYTKRFSIPALRASVGVLVYLKTRSSAKMAEALGHTEYHHDLLSRYLPTPILEFFQERWVRIFQAGVIVHAMEDSPYLLDAAGLEDAQALDEFLRNHALKICHAPEMGEVDSTQSQPDREVLISVNMEILTVMVSLKLAVEKNDRAPTGKAIYWATISEKVIEYIESDSCRREDLKWLLAGARKKADARMMQELIYV